MRLLSSSRKMPGRIIGVSVDSRGKPALRMAMQTREQHIRRDKATSNICTAQALLANISAFYAVYHGPEGLTTIANRIHRMTCLTANAIKNAGFNVPESNIFDTFTVDVGSKGRTAQQVQDDCAKNGVNVRVIDTNTVGISFGETITVEDQVALVKAFGISKDQLSRASLQSQIPSNLQRKSAFLTHPVFNTCRSETQMLRYIKHLENKDLSLNFSMISLGSCTMKLNASVEMFPVTWPETGNIHPFAPADQTVGYREMIESLNADLAKITGFAAVSAQPNSGAQVRSAPVF
jgi:glycine dehydrogenase